MRILIAHNRYQHRGGEDNVASAEADLLRDHGHQVSSVSSDNDHIQGMGNQIKAACGSIYSLASRQRMRQAIETTRPDVVHVHNFFPSLSPSVFHACAEASVPVVHTLHNFRIVCAGATLYRDGAVCEECVEHRSMLPGIAHACYRSSRVGSAISGMGMAVHEHLGTWSEKISAYIALSAFAADKLGSFRIPRNKIQVKPNFTKDMGVGPGDGNYALFVGRLSPEKGLSTLIEADRVGQLTMDVVVLGDGPMRDQVHTAAERPGSRLIAKGFVEREEALQYMRAARVLLLPSLWYEAGFPLVAIEAFSLGLPVIAAKLGNMADAVRHLDTGLLYSPGDPQALAAALNWYAQHPATAAAMRSNARQHYLETHTPEKNYEQLIGIYSMAQESRL